MLEKSIVKLVCAFIVLFYALPVFVGMGVKYQNHRESLIAEQEASILREVHVLSQRSINIKPVNLEHLKCLATNIYHEAGSEPFMGQVAVARVVMNRIKHGFGPNPCRVIYQAIHVPDPENPDETKKVCQFSWVCQGKGTPSNNHIYRQAEEIARQVLVEDKFSDQVPSNVLFFHNTGVSPGWAYHRVMTIGNHIFYSKGKARGNS